MRASLGFLFLLLSLGGCASIDQRAVYPRPAPRPPVKIPANRGRVAGAVTETISTVSAAPAGPAYDARLTRYPYPFPVHFFNVASQGQVLEMAYMDESGPNAGRETVLLLHGKNFPSAYWATTMRPLVARGYRVIAVDQIGFGKSSKPVRFQFSFGELADDTRQLLDFLRVGRVSVVGHSMGGMLAVRLARMFPDRVARLVLVNPLGLEDWQQSVPYRTVSDLYHQELQQSPADLKRYMQANYFGGAWNPAYDELLNVSLGWRNGPDRRLIAWESALTSDMIFTQPVLHELPQLGMPTLLIIGQRDRTAPGKDRVGAPEAATLGLYPTLGRLAAEAIPHATLKEIAGAGHLPQVDSFDEYFQALEGFLPHD